MLSLVLHVKDADRKGQLRAGERKRWLNRRREVKKQLWFPM
jgi:hypothetical protein